MQAGIEKLVEQIRKEEREKILEEIKHKENKPKPLDHISNYIEDWGERNDIPNWHLHKIKNAVYTIIRYSLDIDRMAHLEEEHTSMAECIASNILEIIYPVS